MHWPIALVQLFFTLGWTVYVIFLPGLLKVAGIDISWLPWILIIDQLLFAVADVATGVWLDRSEQFMRKAGNWITALVLVACAVFVLLPVMAKSMPAWLFLPALFVWVICSSVLRVPPLVLLAKYATPQQPASMRSPIAAYLFGLGVAGASPYRRVPGFTNSIHTLHVPEPTRSRLGTARHIRRAHRGGIVPRSLAVQAVQGGEVAADEGIIHHEEAK